MSFQENDSTFKQPLAGLGIIIVLYKVGLSELNEKVNDFTSNGASIFVIDNTPGTPISKYRETDLQENKIYYESLGHNAGVATALNIGIKEALLRGLDYVVTFDQDSHISAIALSQLYSSYRKLEATGLTRLAIGPLPINRISGASYLRRIKRLELMIQGLIFWKSKTESIGMIYMQEIITSGLLANRETYMVNGFYDEMLFIDYVDHEWCWRLKGNEGFCAVNRSVRLDHLVGQGELSFLGGLKISSPKRAYFLFRNGIFLLLSRRMPFGDSVKFILMMPCKIITALFMPSPFDRINFMLKGIVHGMLMSSGIRLTGPLTTDM
jgi:rhamnosyltransferase